MTKVKVLYFDQTAGEVEDSFLNDLIAKRQIAAFCGSSGWVDVLYDKVTDITAEQKVVERQGQNMEQKEISNPAME